MYSTVSWYNFLLVRSALRRGRTITNPPHGMFVLPSGEQRRLPQRARGPSWPQHPFRIKEGGIACRGCRIGEGLHVPLRVFEGDGGRLLLVRDCDIDDAGNGRKALLDDMRAGRAV